MTTSSNLNYDFMAWGSNAGKTSPGFGYAGAKTIITGTATDVKSTVVVVEESATSTLWFQIPKTALQLDATHNHLQAVVLFGQNGDIHSMIPATTNDAAFTSFSTVATQTISGL
ncbi:MAG: hypothetical protein WCG80_07385 [Spirochaetales bacterium]